jgi:hypothetical protein
MSATEGRTQNLRDFTVQIRHATTGAVVGTGVVVSNDGQVVTCAHVVKAALGVHPRQAKEREVNVYFPQVRGNDEEKRRRAKVAACCHEHDDDVVVLQLTDGPAPLGPEQVAVLGTAELAEGHKFRSYGYSQIGIHPATRAEGIILGTIQAPANKNLRADPVQLQSRQIDRGMSGAAVLDEEHNLVVGLISERYYPSGPVKDDIGYAVDAYALTFDPFNFRLRREPLPLRPAPQPKTDLAEARAQVALDLGVAWNNAPPPLAGEWAGRDDLLRDLSADWADPAHRVTGLIGFGGEGKSSLARRWVETLLASSPLPLREPRAPLREASLGPGARAASPLPLGEPRAPLREASLGPGVRTASPLPLGAGGGGRPPPPPRRRLLVGLLRAPQRRRIL